MLERKAYQKLLDWKKSSKKALCILGARQIGKTTLVREFGKREYKYFVELNFITDKNSHKIFADSLDANTIITNLTAYLHTPLHPHETLILLDEIQECPQARTAIKFLVEDGRFDYIETGSLLGIKYKEVSSYPVGYEEIYQMYPMDFEEFLYANGIQPEIINYLHKSFINKTPITESVHETLNKLFYHYIVIGGMPDVVNTYVHTHDIGKVIALQRSILDLYRQDISKYSNSKIKIKTIFDSIPSQLNDKNRRFMLSKIDPNGRNIRYSDSFTWLNDAGIAISCFNISEPVAPLSINEKRNLYKLYMGDVGLLCAACMENIQLDLLQGNLDINMGSILENVIAQQLVSNGFNLHYFDSKKYGELDFVIQNGLKIQLIEVKSGNDFKNHNALNKIIQVKEWNNNAFVLCKGNIEVKDNITYLPWYFSMFITHDKFPENYISELDLSTLHI